MNYAGSFYQLFCTITRYSIDRFSYTFERRVLSIGHWLGANGQWPKANGQQYNVVQDRINNLCDALQSSIFASNPSAHPTLNPMFFDLPPAILHQCREILGSGITTVSFIGGGDINQARLLETTQGKYFIKFNTGADAGSMFETEAKGLALIATTNVIRTPGVLGFGQTEDGAFILLEFVEKGYRGEGFWEKFGASLAALHRQTSSQFGLGYDNFIGSLPQSNRSAPTWPEFFIHERLQPQLTLAAQNNRLQKSDFQRFEKIFEKVPSICPAEPPALVHGDLWSGNFIVGVDNLPVLVDPSVAWSHREMDLAMSRLFGGFERPFYRSYEDAFPLAPGFEERLPLYQLYYLLVHVNLFGGGYVGSVRSILQQFV